MSFQGGVFGGDGGVFLSLCALNCLPLSHLLQA